jgi:outer membrane protein assembly factor BamE (lipoprotein component of BamABCDE complex)
MWRKIRNGALVLAVLPVAGCGFFAAQSQVRGNRVTNDELAELVPGVSTRTDVASLLGTPTMHASFDDNVWLYLGSVTRPVIAGTQHVNSLDTVAITFNQAGLLTGVQVAHKKNALPMTMLARTTPSPGGNASFMQQLLGNVGKFNAGGAGAQTNAVGTAANGSGDGGDSSRFGTGQ